MEIISIPNNIKVFGNPVTTFPQGIEEAFEELDRKLPKHDTRPFYGLSQCIDGTINYVAAAAENFPNEGEKYGYETFEIEKGEYFAEKVIDWTAKTGTIKDVFAEMLQSELIDKSKPCIEIYSSLKEMLCLVKALHQPEVKHFTNKIEIRNQLDNTLSELISELKNFNDENINRRRDENAWSPGQIGKHLLMSYGVVEVLRGKTQKTERKPDEKKNDIKRVFLDFSAKFQAAAEIIPGKEPVKKDELIESLQERKAQLLEIAETRDLTETCLDFVVPYFGQLTRLEWLYLIIYHTQRHIRQISDLNNWIRAEIKHRDEQVLN